MIFYFSGTNNSAYVAKRIEQKIQEKVIAISKDCMKAEIDYELEDGERIGLIFPVYWYGMPTIVEDFLNHIHIKGYKGQYVYSVATYGIAAGNVMKDVEMAFQKKGIVLQGKFGIKMVDNYVVGYDLIKPKKQELILDQADRKLTELIDLIQKKVGKEDIKTGPIGFFSHFLHYFYKKAKHITRFNVNNDCNGCGACVHNCPCNVITLQEDKPKWSGKCTFCLGCINKCPQNAIQYGLRTRKRHRYQNPRY